MSLQNLSIRVQSFSPRLCLRTSPQPRNLRCLQKSHLEFLQSADLSSNEPSSATEPRCIFQPSQFEFFIQPMALFMFEPRVSIISLSHLSAHNSHLPFEFISFSPRFSGMETPWSRRLALGQQLCSLPSPIGKRRLIFYPPGQMAKLIFENFIDPHFSLRVFQLSDGR